jgi:outer membrane receptor protein involved in Fe transport
VALRWTPTKEVLVRGSYSTGFRRPTLSDIFLPRFLSNTATRTTIRSAARLHTRSAAS